MDGRISSDWRDEVTGDRLSLTWDTIDVQAVIQWVQDDRAGAISSFIGTTRNTFEGKSVVSLEYEAYNEMAISSMKEIILKIRQQWDVAHIAIQHKLGSCPVGDASVVIAISSEHRKESLQAVAFAIDDLKANVPIWKKECYDGGAASWKANKEFLIDNGSTSTGIGEETVISDGDGNSDKCASNSI